MSHTITVRYYALLREERGLEEESINTGAATVAELYEELLEQHGFSLTRERLWVAVNDEMATWQQTIKEGDTVVFIPPVAGG